jgi:hypothetical protein
MTHPLIIDCRVNLCNLYFRVILGISSEVWTYVIIIKHTGNSNNAVSLGSGLTGFILSCFTLQGDLNLGGKWGQYFFLFTNSLCKRNYTEYMSH